MKCWKCIFFRQATVSKDNAELTNGRMDLLEGLLVGQKYVEDLDKLERDMVQL